MKIKDKNIKKVLVIDDDDTIREFASEILSAEGYYVIDVNNAEEGISILNGSKSGKTKSAFAFDAVVCDIMMPGADGFEVLKKLKRSRKNIPVFIFITARKDRKDLRQAMEAGADDFISKPFTADELIHSVRVQLEKKLIAASAYSELSKNARTDIADSGETETDSPVFKYTDKVFVSKGSKARFVDVKDIVVIKSLKDYTQLFNCSKEYFYIRKPLKNWSSSLPAEHFLLANRSEIINIDYILQIHKLHNNTHEVELKCHASKIKISRRVSTKLKNIIRNL